MNREQQDLAWQRLPKDVREGIKEEYQNVLEGSDLESFLVDYFGFHNLASDTELSALLFVERKEAQKLYADYKNRITPTIGAVDKAAYGGVLLALQELFSDKCLPDKEPSDLSTQDPKPSTQDNDNMEEKELNLPKLLEGCEGEKFYSPVCGEIEFIFINEYYSQPLAFSNPDMNIHFRKNGSYYPNGECILFPSRALYEKYPLDAYSAWMEWKEERKPKRWRARENQSYWRMKGNGEISRETENRLFFDDQHYNCMNYFRTEEQCKQAAEAVRECLMKFHENQSKQ